MDSDTRECSNCQKETRLSHALTVQQGGRVIAVICDSCQQAKKIQVTFEQKKEGWTFLQYFPVET